MTLAIDGSGPAIAVVTGTQTTVTTASFTPPAGSQLWVGTACNNSGAGGTFTMASSPALTFGSARITTTVQEAPCAWFSANVATSQAYTVTSTRTGAVATNGFSVYAIVVTGQETTPGGATATANSNSGTPTVGITTTRDGSIILAAIGDWSAGGAGTAGTSQTILAEQNLAGQYTAHYWRYNGTPVASTYTINLTAPTAEDYNLAVVEVRAAAIPSPPLARRAGIPAAILTR